MLYRPVHASCPPVNLVLVLGLPSPQSSSVTPPSQAHVCFNPCTSNRYPSLFHVVTQTLYSAVDSSLPCLIYTPRKKGDFSCPRCWLRGEVNQTARTVVFPPLQTPQPRTTAEGRHWGRARERFLWDRVRFQELNPHRKQLLPPKYVSSSSSFVVCGS